MLKKMFRKAMNDNNFTERGICTKRKRNLINGIDKRLAVEKQN